jgi:hypothetical protein
MAYGGYYPYYTQNSSLTPNFASFTQNQPSNVQNNGIIWVCGEAGAKSYLVAPNTTVALWDSESQTIYLKSADASGMPSIKTLDYTVRDRVQADLSHENTSKVEFVTREEFDALKRQIEALTRTEVKSDDE